MKKNYKTNNTKIFLLFLLTFLSNLGYGQSSLENYVNSIGYGEILGSHTEYDEYSGESTTYYNGGGGSYIITGSTSSVSDLSTPESNPNNILYTSNTRTILNYGGEIYNFRNTQDLQFTPPTNNLGANTHVISSFYKDVMNDTTGQLSFMMSMDPSGNGIVLGGSGSVQSVYLASGGTLSYNNGQGNIIRSMVAGLSAEQMDRVRNFTAIYDTTPAVVLNEITVRSMSNIGSGSFWNSAQASYNTYLAQQAQLAYWENIATRTLGGLQMVGGLVEALVGGVGGVVTSETGAGAALGYLGVVNGIDNTIAGYKTLTTGQQTDTLLHQGVAAGATALGASPGVANGIATATEIVAGVGLGVAVVTSEVKAGSLANSLTGGIKSSFDKLIGAGLNAVEQGSVVKLFNSENKLVAEIANNKIVFKYSGYGGDITMIEGKSTAIFGRFNDPIHGGGTKEFIQNSSKVYETGANPNGINILNISDWTWAKNEAWVIESANRGDIIRFISDPKNPTNIFKNGISGEMTVTGLEVQTLENLGYVWDPSKFQFIKP